MKIAFNTANLIGRVTGYKFQLNHWMEQHMLTIDRTDEAEWRGICREIAGAGYTAVEIWEAHAAPEVMTPDRLVRWKEILNEFGLTAVAYAGGYSPQTVDICKAFGISLIAGGGRAQSLADTERLARESQVAWCFENHPQKSADAISAAIEGGNEWIGVAVDTGWLGTQGVPAPDAIRALGPLVRHVHLKDVAAPGGHETVPFGEGCVDPAGVIVALKEIGYKGWISWEDEPENRNPFDIAVQTREWIERRLA